MVSHPETGSDSPIGSDQDRGRDTNAVAEVLQYSGSRVKHRDGFSSYKLIYSDSKW